METLLAPVNDAARSLGVCRATVYNLLKTGQLQSVKMGRRTMIKAESLRALADTGAAELIAA